MRGQRRIHYPTIFRVICAFFFQKKGRIHSAPPL
jgi:hypothetical protein